MSELIRSTVSVSIERDGDSTTVTLAQSAVPEFVEESIGAMLASAAIAANQASTPVGLGHDFWTAFFDRFTEAELHVPSQWVCRFSEHLAYARGKDATKYMNALIPPSPYPRPDEQEPLR